MIRSWMMVVVAALAGAACAAGQEITVRETVVFDGRAGWEHGGATYRLACGASLCEAANGDLLCWWLSGTDNEPSRDNNVLAARSTDRGKTWGAPWILVEAGAEAAAVTSVQALPDGRLVALGAGWPSELQYTVWHYFRMESKDHGATWSAREPFRLRPEENVMLGRPVRLANGEFLFPASFFERRPVPLTAPIEALARAASEAEALALPPAPDARPDKFCTHLHGASAVTTADPELRGLTEHAGMRNRPLGLLEGTAVQLRDGRVVMLMRAEYGGFLWRAESRDNGRTWTDARQTDIPNPTSLPALLRLPDGRIALIHNAVGGVVGRGAVRDPLSVWLSDDEMETWSVQADVITGGQLAYPCPLIVDGRLVFAYDRDRRETRFVEVALPPGAEAPAK